MFIDTHCHFNMMIKDNFDTIIPPSLLPLLDPFIDRAQKKNVSIIINVGTSLIESKNCIAIAAYSPIIYATVGIHPNDATDSWKTDFKDISALAHDKKRNRIVGIGECGIDRHYPDYNISRQKDVFRAHIDLALENDLALVVHSRDAAEETLSVIDEYKNNYLRGIMHCYSYTLAYAQDIITRNFALGIGGTITYPKNNTLREVVKNVPLKSLVLETDAPYLPPQTIRGQKNGPWEIASIASYMAELTGRSLNDIASITTARAQEIFKL